MKISKEELTGYKEAFEKVHKFVNEESKNDPYYDPFRSHQKAYALLSEQRQLIESARMHTLVSDGAKSEKLLEYNSLLASWVREMARISIFMGDNETGEVILKDSLGLLETNLLQPLTIIPHVGDLNELGIVYANRKNYKEAFETLCQSEQAYKDFKKTKAVPLTIYDLFGTADEVEPGKGMDELDSLYTLCTFYLAQVYGHLGELEKSADYCHLTLCRQLDSKKYDPIDFALNAATLSQYYIGELRFEQARHHLAAATLVMDNYEKEMITPYMTVQELNDVKETFKHRYADVARCWAKFGLGLMRASKKRLFADDDENGTGEDEKLTKTVESLQLNECDYRFKQLNVSAIENRISCDYCLTFSDAKLVFHFVKDWLNQAKEYYKAETEASEYAKIIKDCAENYELIAFFEESAANRAKMHKKRAKYYEELLEELNEGYYLDVCRECWYGAATAYALVLDIKLDEMNAKKTPSPVEIKKINRTARKAIEHFDEYIDSYMELKGDKWCSDMDVEEQRTMLYAHFHLGRLYYKLISFDPEEQLENLTDCLKYYKYFTTECDARKEASATLLGEIGVCREMVNLLPVRIDTLKKRIA